MKNTINILALTIETSTTNKLFKSNYPSLIFQNKVFLREDKNKGLVDFKKFKKRENINIFTKKELKKYKRIDYEMHFYSNIPRLTNSKLLLILPEHHFVDKFCKKEIIEKNMIKFLQIYPGMLITKSFFT